MAIKTINNKDELEDLIEQNRFVIVAALGAGFEPGDMEFERIAQEHSQGHVAFAKFMIEEAPELVDYFDINDVATVITFIGGEKGPVIPGFEPDVWERMVRDVTWMQ